MENARDLRPYERAFKAGLVLVLGDDRRAEQLFRHVAEEAAGLPGPNARYVRLYCRYYIAGLTGDLDEERESLSEARKTPCKPILKSWLPLS